MIDLPRRAAPDGNEREAAQQLVVGKRSGDRRLDIHTVLDQHDRGARADGRPDQLRTVDALQHLRSQQQIGGRLAAVRDVAINVLRLESMVAEHGAADVVTVATHRVVVRAAHDRNPRALTRKR